MTYVKHVEHNHELFRKFKVDLIHRRNEMTKKMLKKIANATISLQISKQFHINFRKKIFYIDIIFQNIYNVKKKIKNRKLNRHIFTQYLLKYLKKKTIDSSNFN